MNIRSFLLIGSLVAWSSWSNSENPGATFSSAKFAGIYSFGQDVEKEPVGSITVFPETDSTLLFYLDICKGAPSYNLGQLFDRVVLHKDSASCFTKEEWNKNGCKLKFFFQGDTLTIKTVEPFSECPFGGNVYADHDYVRRNKLIPNYFINGEGDTIPFKKMSPEQYVHRFDTNK
jgi:hypothetical protein